MEYQMYRAFHEYVSEEIGNISLKNKTKYKKLRIHQKIGSYGFSILNF